ncbi:hypothetical protein ACFY2T_09755 [Streptomyces sp. NPDC001260]|uniref:hypothetical protein n=1 Tax=Streptomyces sp. NPDC001260 TaxID=3364551 RepID=UPI00367BF289
MRKDQAAGGEDAAAEFASPMRDCCVRYGTAIETVRAMLAEVLGEPTTGRNAGPAALEAVRQL